MMVVSFATPSAAVACLGFKHFAAWSISTMTNFDLVNWTMQKARQLGPGHHLHNEIKSPPALENLLEVLDGDRPGNNRAKTGLGGAESDQAKGPSPTADPTNEPATDLPVAVKAEPPTAAGEQPALNLSARLKAIIKPDIYTAPSDRDRAIILRWVLRDIKADRLKLSPVNQRDLRDLIELGLVEMANDAPILTPAGVKAIG
jgi:hypothetical protein